MAKEQSESGGGGLPSLEPILSTVEYYNNIAKQLKEDLDLLGRWLQQQNPCSVKANENYTPYIYDNPITQNGFDGLPPSFEQSTWSLIGYLQIDEGYAWSLIENGEKQGWIRANLIDVFDETNCAAGWLNPADYDFDNLLILKDLYGIVLSGEYTIDEIKILLILLAQAIDSNIAAPFKFDDRKTISLQELYVAISEIRTLRDYGILLAGKPWRIHEIHEVLIAVNTGIATLGGLVGQANAIAAYRSLMGYNPTGITTIIHFNQESIGDGIASNTGEGEIKVAVEVFGDFEYDEPYDQPYGPENIREAQFPYVPYVVIGHEIAHNVTFKYFTLISVSGEIQIPVWEDGAVTCIDVDSYIGDFYAGYMEEKYIVTRDHTVQCTQVDGDCSATIKAGETFEFSPSHQSLSRRKADHGFVYTVRSNASSAEVLADAINAYLLDLYYNDPNGTCCDNLAGSIRREQGELLVQALLAERGFISAQENCE